MSRTYQLSIVSEPDEIETLRPGWDALETASPFRKPFWLLKWWDHVRPGGMPQILVAKDEAGEVVGVLPLYRQKQSYEGSVLRSFGDHGVCSDYFSLVGRVPDRPSLALAFANFLASLWQDSRWGWDRIELDGVAESDAAMQTFVSELNNRGAVSHASSRMSFWRLDTDRSWEEWLGEFGGSNRRRLRARLKQLETLPRIAHSSPNSEEDVQRLTQVVIDLHQARWNASGSPGSFAAPATVEFIHAANQLAYAAGQLHLSVLMLDGIAAAGELGYVGEDDCLYLYCVGRNPAMEALEVGYLQTVYTQHRAFASHIKAIDYLRGDEAYKQRAHSQPNACLQLRIASPGWSARLFHKMWLTQFELTQFLRRRTGRQPLRTSAAFSHQVSA